MSFEMTGLDKEYIRMISKELWNLGVQPGGVLLVHSSLSALGYVPGGAQTVILALLETIEAAGTLLMPALSYETVTPAEPIFELLHTPCCVGVIPETFRLLPGVLRSLHPTHSVCAAGPLAQQMLDPHAQDVTPCGPHSPFHCLPEFGGQILMLGCGLEPNTSMHAIEELCAPTYLYDPPISYRLVLEDGSTKDKMYTPHAFHGWRQRYDRVAQVLLSPGLRQGHVLQATAHLIEAAALREAALAVLRRDPLFFVDRD